MEKNTYLESIDFKSINVVIAVLSGLVTIALAFAPNTVSALLKIDILFKQLLLGSIQVEFCG